MEYGKETEITSLLDRIEEVLEEGKSVFMSNKVSVDREELIEIVKDIRLKMPSELQQAVWIMEERNKILAESQTEAAIIVQEAQDTLQKMINQHEITKYANERAQYILENARTDSREIHHGAIEYAEDIFKNVEQKLKESMEVVHKEMINFEAYVNDVFRQIYDNRQELKGALNYEQQKPE
ncbi:MAG: hypothetical protein ACRCSG_04415 [Cellulosilyticaceae bacterium]